MPERLESEVLHKVRYVPLPSCHNSKFSYRFVLLLRRPIVLVDINLGSLLFKISCSSVRIHVFTVTDGRTDGRTGGQTDRRTNGRPDNTMLPCQSADLPTLVNRQEGHTRSPSLSFSSPLPASSLSSPVPFPLLTLPVSHPLPFILLSLSQPLSQIQLGGLGTSGIISSPIGSRQRRRARPPNVISCKGGVEGFAKWVNIITTVRNLQR